MGKKKKKKARKRFVKKLKKIPSNRLPDYRNHFSHLHSA